jgi:signal transduction histidine kinase
MAAISPPDPLFRGGGELGAMMRAFDWATTPLGPSAAWPPELRTTVRLLLAAHQPMLIGWSRDLIVLYNDAYRQLLGTDKHPRALGAPLAEVFAGDAYPLLKPVYDALLDRGEAVAFEGASVPLIRSGYLEEAFFDFGYTPVFYEDGAVGGMFVACTESTLGVLAHRRTVILAELATRLIGVQEPAQIAGVAMALLTQNPQDIPFALLYLPTDTETLTLTAHTGLPEDGLDWPWPTQVAFETQEIQYGQDFGPIRAGPWLEPVVEVAALPLVHADGHSPALGVLIVGISARKRLDEPYRHFLGLLGQQLSSALERVEAVQQQEAQHLELSARARALEAFVELTRDLTLNADPYALVQRAQQIVMSLLPEGFVLYYEPEGSVWRLKSQVGDLQSVTLQAAIDQGLPYDTTRSLLRPWTTRTSSYQDKYDQTTDQLDPEQVAHVHATATLPLLVRGEPRGVFAAVMLHEHRWTATDKAVLDTVIRSLGLALEGAQGLAQLAEERRKLENINRELEAFSYSVSHDLRTPVRHILSFNSLLRKALSGQLDEKASHYLQVIEDAAGRMNTLIDAMLELSQTSRLPLQVSGVDLGALIQDIVTELEMDALNRRVDWHLSTLPLVVGDPKMLRQVIVNLLSNALKYTRTREVTQIRVWGEEHPDEWAVFVEDNGVGFDPRYADKLFGVFQRLHRQDEFEGTGVGLANVRQIVTRHGGEVTAVGRLGQGATFGLTLPKQRGG